MKKVLNILLFILFPIILQAQDVVEINYDSLDVKKNIAHLKDKDKTLFTGRAFRLDKDGLVVEKTMLKEGYREGKTEYFSTNGGLIKEESYKNNLLNGVTIEYFDKEVVHKEIHYKEGMRHGVSKLFMESGTLLQESEYKLDQLDGLTKIYFENGTLSEERNYGEDKFDGTTKIYFEDGTINQISNYREGKLHGLYQTYRKGGELALESYYANDKLEGLTKTFDETSTLREESNYANDKKEGLSKMYYANSKLHKEEEYANGKKDGTVKTYTEEGILSDEASYKDDKKHGAWRWYYADGTLKWDLHYKNDKEDGVHKRYKVDGELEQETLFRNGKVVHQASDHRKATEDNKLSTTYTRSDDDREAEESAAKAIEERAREIEAKGDQLIKEIATTRMSGAIGEHHSSLKRDEGDLDKDIKQQEAIKEGAKEAEKGGDQLIKDMTKRDGDTAFGQHDSELKRSSEQTEADIQRIEDLQKQAKEALEESNQYVKDITKRDSKEAFGQHDSELKRSSEQTEADVQHIENLQKQAKEALAEGDKLIEDMAQRKSQEAFGQHDSELKRSSEQTEADIQHIEDLQKQAKEALEASNQYVKDMTKRNSQEAFGQHDSELKRSSEQTEADIQRIEDLQKQAKEALEESNQYVKDITKRDSKEAFGHHDSELKRSSEQTEADVQHIEALQKQAREALAEGDQLIKDMTKRNSQEAFGQHDSELKRSSEQTETDIQRLENLQKQARESLGHGDQYIRNMTKRNSDEAYGRHDSELKRTSDDLEVDIEFREKLNDGYVKQQEKSMTKMMTDTVYSDGTVFRSTFSNEHLPETIKQAEKTRTKEEEAREKQKKMAEEAKRKRAATRAKQTK